MKTRSRWLVAALPLTTALAMFASSEASRAEDHASAVAEAPRARTATTTAARGDDRRRPRPSAAAARRTRRPTDEAPKRRRRATDEWAARDNAVDGRQHAHRRRRPAPHDAARARAARPGSSVASFTTELHSRRASSARRLSRARTRAGGAAHHDATRTNHIGATRRLERRDHRRGSRRTSPRARSRTRRQQQPPVAPPGARRQDPRRQGRLRLRHEGLLARRRRPSCGSLNGTGAVGSTAAARARGSSSARPATSAARVEDPAALQLNLTYSSTTPATSSPTPRSARGTPITRIERFGLGINRVDHFDIALGAETFVAERRSPSVHRVHARRSRSTARTTAASRRTRAATTASRTTATSPSNLTIGARFFPWKRGFVAHRGARHRRHRRRELHRRGRAERRRGCSTSAPAGRFDTQDRPPVEKIKTVEKPIAGKAPVRGHIKGFVHEKDKAERHRGRDRRLGQPPRAHRARHGRRRPLHDARARRGHLHVRHQGRRLQGRPVRRRDRQVRRRRPARLPARGAPARRHASSATCATPRRTGRSRARRSRPRLARQGALDHRRLERRVPLRRRHAGRRRDHRRRDGYLALRRQGRREGPPGQHVDPIVRHKPKNGERHRRQGRDHDQAADPVRGRLGDVILPESTRLLTEIADVLIKNPRIKRVEVQGHTDNTGTPEHNKQLSDDRAASVRTWLVAHGVSADRLVAKGYGQTKPLVPNVTTANKRARTAASSSSSWTRTKRSAARAAGTPSSRSDPSRLTSNRQLQLALLALATARLRPSADEGTGDALLLADVDVRHDGGRRGRGEAVRVGAGRGNSAGWSSLR